MEGRLGKFIYGAKDIVSNIQEGYRLDREEKRTTREYQQMLKRFGGINGTDVTSEQITEYLKIDLKSISAINKHMHFSNPQWPLFQSEFLQRLEMAQNLQTPEGKVAATEWFIKAKETRIQFFSLLDEPSSRENKFTIEHDRLIRANEAAISLLSS